MRRMYTGMLGCVLVTAALACGGERHGPRHEGAAATTVPEPTPDTTPVEPLRTPAGLALKPEPATTAAMPAGTGTSAAPSASPKSTP